jgi:hypothetical protein
MDKRSLTDRDIRTIPILLVVKRAGWDEGEGVAPRKLEGNR